MLLLAEPPYIELFASVFPINPPTLLPLPDTFPVALFVVSVVVLVVEDVPFSTYKYPIKPPIFSLPDVFPVAIFPVVVWLFGYIYPANPPVLFVPFTSTLDFDVFISDVVYPTSPPVLFPVAVIVLVFISQLFIVFVAFPIIPPT